MKRLLINTTILIILAGLFASCKKRIEDDYMNPELTTTGSLGKLLSGMYMNKRVRPSYWDYYTFIMSVQAPYAQTVALQPTTQMYIPSTSYTQDRWTDFYAGSWSKDDNDPNYYGPGIMGNYREMQTSYKALTPVQQQQQDVFLKCAEVLLYDQASQMIDMWGDIPFNQAGSLNTDRKATGAPFDDAATLYNTFIANLKSLNTYFDTANIITSVSAELKLQDMMYKGDLSKWQRYVNSLRLRLLMRISNVSEAAARTEVTAMLSNPATYPLITDNEQNAVIKMSSPALKSDLGGVFSDFRVAPAYLLDTLMLANNDPRTPVYWDTNQSGQYVGFPYNGSSSDFETVGKYATYDSATFNYNYNIPGVLFTASEASFLQAEAYERWSVGTPQTAYETGIRQSIAFYYDLNHSTVFRAGGAWDTLHVPQEPAITAYILKPAIAYSGTATQKLAKIYTQKWEHFFILQSGQPWAELRRTGYPALKFATASASGATTPPVRLLYPSAEQLYNADNYSKVSSKDTRNTRIFWDIN